MFQRLRARIEVLGTTKICRSLDDHPWYAGWRPTSPSLYCGIGRADRPELPQLHPAAQQRPSRSHVAAVHDSHVGGGERVGEDLDLRAVSRGGDQFRGAACSGYEIRREDAQVPLRLMHSGQQHAQHLGSIGNAQPLLQRSVADEPPGGMPSQVGLAGKQRLHLRVLAQHCVSRWPQARPLAVVEHAAQRSNASGETARDESARDRETGASSRTGRNVALTSRTTSPTINMSRSIKLSTGLASKYSSPRLRPPTSAMRLSAIQLLLCMRWLRRRKSVANSPALRASPLRLASGLYIRTSRSGCASSAANPASFARAGKSSTKMRTRTPRSAASSACLASSLPVRSAFQM